MSQPKASMQMPLATTAAACGRPGWFVYLRLDRSCWTVRAVWCYSTRSVCISEGANKLPVHGTFDLDAADRLSASWCMREAGHWVGEGGGGLCRTAKPAQAPKPQAHTSSGLSLASRMVKLATGRIRRGARAPCVWVAPG